jgi:signal transduction histidine kinase
LSFQLYNTDKLSDILPVLSQGADDLIELIKSQKDLLSAETNELSVYKKTINAKELLHSVRGLLERNDLLQGRQISIHDVPGTIHLSSDERILKRVITNAVKNALEAVMEGETVHLRYKRDGANILFEIQNSSYIPEEVQSRIFRKSFSTKSQDRGVGTYSIKLFTEKYLNGQVWFQSRKGEGTTFYIQIPVQ